MPFAFPSLRCACWATGAASRRTFLIGLGATVGSTIFPYRAAASGPVPAIGQWLALNPAIAKTLTWDFGKNLPYAAWPAPFQEMFRAAFARAWHGEPSGLVDPAPNLNATGDDERIDMVLTLNHAFAIFAALASQSLVNEIDRRVPWSLSSLNERALEQLFTGRVLFSKMPSREDAYRVLLHGMPAPPEVTMAFLRSNGIIGTTRIETIVRLLSWCRDKLTHYMYGSTGKNLEDHWGVRTSPPASRIISGTIYAAAKTPQDRLLHHYTAGCWGTTAFLASTLRAINIPVQQLHARDPEPDGTRFGIHSAAHFMSESLCLVHSDDPYDANCRLQPGITVRDLLISREQFARWFPPGVKPSKDMPRNVNRRVHELAIAQLPIYALNRHAGDILAKRSRPESEIMRWLTSSYSLQELEALELWDRLDSRLAQLGGAQKVQAIYRSAVNEYLKSATSP